MDQIRQRMTVCILCVSVLATGLSACGSKEESAESVSSVSVSTTSQGETIQHLQASSVELPEGDENGPHPDNVIDIHIERGSYVLPKFEDDPGFTQVYAEEVVANADMRVLSDMDEHSDLTGILKKGDSFSILSEEEGKWVYIESGKVRGFLKDPAWIHLRQEEQTYAEVIAPSYKNDAFLYKQITTQENPAPTIFAISRVNDLAIREERSREARTVGTLAKDGTGYVLEECGDGWLYIESGYVRGFVEEENLLVGEKAEEYMREQESWQFVSAIAEILFTENKAAYYTCTSVDPGRSAQDQAREYMQVLGHDRTGELEIPETFNGRRVGWIYSCTPDYGIRNWMYESLEILQMWRRYGSVYRENIAMIDNFYLIACTGTYGKVGDYVTFYLDDGTPLHCIIADEKSAGDALYTSYGHIHVNDIDVIEAETLYEINPGHEGCAPSWRGHRVCSCVNHGKFQEY